MRTLVDYVRAHDIQIEILSGPDHETEIQHDGTRWEHYAYELELRNGELGTTMTLSWRQGIGITEDPDERPEQILDCIIGDAWGYEQADGFESWAGEYGYDCDSRKAEATYKAVGKTTNDLIDFLGGKPELEKLALHYERL